KQRYAYEPQEVESKHDVDVLFCTAGHLHHAAIEMQSDQPAAVGHAATRAAALQDLAQAHVVHDHEPQTFEAAGTLQRGAADKVEGADTDRRARVGVLDAPDAAGQT